MFTRAISYLLLASLFLFVLVGASACNLQADDAEDSNSATTSSEDGAEPKVDPLVMPEVGDVLEPDASMADTSDTSEPVWEPSAEPVPEPTASAMPEPTAEPTTEPTAEPTTEPTAEPVVEPNVEPDSEPSAEPQVAVFDPEVCEEQPVTKVFEPKVDDVNESAFLYIVPSGVPTGLIAMFHGGGGHYDEIIARPELNLFVQDALAQGLVVASLNSQAHLPDVESDKFKWNTDDTAANPDVQNAIAMIERLKDTGDLAVFPATAPVYLLGGSNGGTFVSRLAQHYEPAAVVVYISNAQVFHQQGVYMPPMVLVAGENDSTVNSKNMVTVYDKAIAEGVDVEFYMNTLAQVTPGVFTRIKGIDCELSKQIRYGLEDAGWLDEFSLLQFNPKQDFSWKASLNQSAAPFQAEIREILMELYAEHSVPAEFNAQVLDFLLSHGWG